MLTPTAVDLLAVDRLGPDGVVWSLSRGGDLDANLVQLAAGVAMGAHVNEEVDVLLVGVSGVGVAMVDDARYELRAGTVVAVPKDASRNVAADANSEVVYLTVHVARPGLRIQPNPTPKSHDAPPERTGGTMKPYVLPDLSYDYSALEPHYSGWVLDLHHDKHHQAYVDGVNTTLEKLAGARAADDLSAIVGLQKTLAFNLSGHVLHSLFWENLSPDGGERPTGELAAAIDEHFGSFDAFHNQLSKAAASVQGSGWGALTWEPLGERLLVEQIYDHQGNVGQGGVPLLVIDAWEHAYYLQYENRRPEYVAAIWNVIDWTNVANRFEQASALVLSPSK